MAWSDSPWLTSLHYAFQDSTSLYLIMDYHPGGDLLNIMERKEGSMQEDEARYTFVDYHTLPIKVPNVKLLAKGLFK